MRTVFLGSGEFARVQLDALLAAGAPPALVVTRPPRRRRRRGALEATPVARRAEEAGVAVFAPEKVNAPGSLDRLRDARAGLFVVAQYGQILSQALLDIPEHGAINVHASLLPRWRGATPVQAAILAGDEETGVTIQRMVRELDAGPVLAARATPVDPREDAGELTARLAALGAQLLVEVVRRFERGDPPEAVPQDDARATVCRRLTPADARLDWSRPAVELERRVRALAPRPGARTALLRDPPLRLVVRAAAAGTGRGEPGRVLGPTGAGLAVATGAGSLELRTLVPEARRAMSGRDFANGFRVEAGERLGDAPGDEP